MSFIDNSSLRNTYYLMRHGNSEANEKGIIVSSPENGCRAFGLSEAGRRTIRKSINNCDSKIFTKAIIFCSDFLRTRETAAMVSDLVTIPCYTVSPLLRERFFGIYEGTSDSNYEKVWAFDNNEQTVSHLQAEEIEHVAQRVGLLLDYIENLFIDKNIFLISHGDVLQITRAMFAGGNLFHHRSMAHINPADIVKVK